MKNKKILKITGGIILVIIIAIICLFVFKDKKTPTYIVTFDSAGGTAIEEQIIEEGALAKKPEDPEKEGYLFVDWLLDELRYDFNTQVNENITLTANWTEVPADKEMITITFNTDGGTIIANAIIEKGNKVEIPSNPVREGYTFIEWTLNGNIFDFETVVTENIELVAKWEKVIATKPNNIVNNNTNTNTNTDTDKIVIKTPTLSVGAGAKGYAELTTGLEGVYATEEGLNQVDGFELYEKSSNKYTKVNSWKVTIDVGESKTYVARAYAYNKSNAKVYSGYSNEIKLENNIETPILSVGAGAKGYAELTTGLEGVYATEDGLNQVDGFELYEKSENKYTKVDSWKVTIDVGESKTYVARAYAYNKSNAKVYSAYSNEVKIDN